MKPNEKPSWDDAPEWANSLGICNFDVEYVERRKGDIGYYVLDNVSPYMKNMFSIVDLCKIV